MIPEQHAGPPSAKRESQPRPLPARARTLVLLFGSPSSERRVSVASAQHVAEAIPAAARLWFWAPQGAVVEVSGDQLRAHQHPFEFDFEPDGKPVGDSLEAALATLGAEEVVLFLCLHGSPGEDGSVQRVLEERRIPYTGSDADSSALAWDKIEAKRVAAAAGLVVAEETVVSAGEAKARVPEIEKLLERWGELIIKPAREGSTIGVRRVAAAGDVQEWVRRLAADRPDVRYLVERRVVGREFTVGVVQFGRDVRALPVTEVITGDGRLFDYSAKYLDPQTQEITPADIDEEQARALRAAGVAAHRAMGCRGHSRSDFVVEEEGRMVFLETNTLPGLTRASFIPQQLSAAGIGMREFVEGQIGVALETHTGQLQH